MKFSKSPDRPPGFHGGSVTNKSRDIEAARDVLFLAVIFLCVAASPLHALSRQGARVSEVLTGDTVRLDGGKVLRYSCLQSPPLQHPIPAIRQYGEDAKAFNRRLVEGKSIQIEWGPQIRDDRDNSLLIGYVFLEDGTFVNKEILAAGHAKSLVKAPNLKYASVFRKTELEARRDKKGLWKTEVDNPYIKHDFIGDKNTKIYYFPTSPELERIPESYLVTFKSRVEAKAAGYKPCFTCKEGEDAPF